MKSRWITTFALTALAGVALHFLYDWLPLPLVGLFAPVNESVWEHLKLLFWPFLAGAGFLSAGAKDKAAFWGAALLAELAMPLVLLGVYYLLKGGFSVERLWIDLALYFVCLALGFFLLYRLREKNLMGLGAGILVLLTAFYAAALILFSIAAPELPVFFSQTACIG